jgi:serine/threonine protein kinase
LLRLKSLDGLEKKDVYNLIGEPETAEVLLRDTSGKSVTAHKIPRYLVYPAGLDLIGMKHLYKEICIADFGQCFDISAEVTRPIGIPRPYCPPEMVFDKAVGITGDLWSLGCLIFEVRLGAKVIFSADVICIDDNEYILAITVILGKLPDRWWDSWKDRHSFFEAAEQRMHDLLMDKPGIIVDTTLRENGEPRSMKEKIVASCYKRDFKETLKKFQDISEDEVELLADLIARLL